MVYGCLAASWPGCPARALAAPPSITQSDAVVASLATRLNRFIPILLTETSFEILFRRTAEPKKTARARASRVRIVGIIGKRPLVSQAVLISPGLREMKKS